jgi:uncharacterized membrane-anchored protein YitT (DUF2179 family)
MTSTVVAVVVAAVVVAAVVPKQKEEKVNQINQKEKDKHFKNHFV